MSHTHHEPPPPLTPRRVLALVILTIVMAILGALWLTVEGR